MLDIALKDWAVVCDLLLEGKLSFLLRKGGIHETGGPGVFELEHPRFVLYPSWAHQKPQMIKEEHRSRVEIQDEPAQITFKGIAEVAQIWQVKSRPALESLDDLHCWTPAHLDMRFGYKPENPLYLVALRCSRLPTPKTISHHAAYTGCRSWFDLRTDDQVDDATGTEPVIDDPTFADLIKRIDATL